MISKAFEVTVSTEEFELMIKSLMSVENSGITIRVYKDRLEAFTITQDSSSILIFTRLKLSKEIENFGEDEKVELWIKTLDKFRRLLGHQRDYKRMKDKENEVVLKEAAREAAAKGETPAPMILPNPYDTFTFKVKDNYILHNSDKIRSAKFLLGEFPARGDIMARKVDDAWFDRFKVQAKFAFGIQELGVLLKNSDFAAGVEKVYFSTEGDTVIFDINDKEKQSSDSISMAITKLLEGEIENDKYILPLNSFRLITIHHSTPAIFMPAVYSNAANSSAMVVSEQIVGNLQIKYLLNGKKK